MANQSKTETMIHVDKSENHLKYFYKIINLKPGDTQVIAFCVVFL